jgi:excisionase family DNA binding protein
MTDVRLQPRQLQDYLPKGSVQLLTLTPYEASKLIPLGINQTYAAIRAGEIPSIRIGRKILIPRAKLLELLNGGGFDAA